MQETLASVLPRILFLSRHRFAEVSYARTNDRGIISQMQRTVIFLVDAAAVAQPDASAQAAIATAQAADAAKRNASERLQAATQEAASRQEVTLYIWLCSNAPGPFLDCPVAELHTVQADKSLLPARPYAATFGGTRSSPMPWMRMAALLVPVRTGHKPSSCLACHNFKA